jgi:hydroxymethylpyrimidine/phosphomethylpyrimidine kinase
MQGSRTVGARACPAVLTVAGSDSGGGAGIQADLKTFRALGCFGVSAITCLTAQNPDGVSGILAAGPRMTRRQIEAVCGAFPVRAAKTGMLFDRATLRAAAAALRRAGIANLVVDPVMVATSGARLLRPDAVEALCRVLLPMARVITPNLPEAEVLWGAAIRTEADMSAAARDLERRFGAACALKGGHLRGAQVVDMLCENGRLHVWRSPRLRAAQTHGTGCTFSAALAAWLARGAALPEACNRARLYVRRALVGALRVGRYRPLGG